MYSDDRASYSTPPSTIWRMKILSWTETRVSWVIRASMAVSQWYVARPALASRRAMCSNLLRMKRRASS